MGTLLQGIHCTVAKDGTRQIDDFMDLANRIILNTDKEIQKEYKHKKPDKYTSQGEIDAQKTKYNLGEYFDDFEEITSEIYFYLKKSYSKFDIYLKEYTEKTDEEKKKWIKTEKGNLGDFLDSIRYYFTRFSFGDLQDKEKRAKELEIVTDCIKLFGKERFKNASDINNFFNTHTDHTNFPDWFNAKIGKKGFWAAGTHYEKTRSNFSIHNKENFIKMWDNIIDYIEMKDGEGIHLFQFLSIQSPAINETKGTLALVSEIGGLKYMFKYNYFNKNGGSIEQNRTANLLFKDNIFLDAHKSENTSTHKKIKDLKDDEMITQWGGYETYPAGYEVEPANDLFISQADFYKFRGRGYIQITHRAAYKKLAHAIREYSGTNTIIKGFKDDWNESAENETDKELAHDKILTKSKNKEWEKLFMETDYIIAGMAIKVYNSGYQVMEMNKENYNTQDIFNHDYGTFYRIGRTIGGSDDYGRVVRGRIFQMLKQLINDAKNKQN